MKKLLLALVAFLVVIQFFKIDKTNPAIDKKSDFLVMKNTPENVATLIKNACYDCHSNESVYPWYTNVQPIAWFVKNHIDEGREELNFSTFGTYDAVKQARKLKKAAREVLENEMPLSSYTIIHQNAKLTEEQTKTLEAYFTTMKDITMMKNGISEDQLKPQKH